MDDKPDLPLKALRPLPQPPHGPCCFCGLSPARWRLPDARVACGSCLVKDRDLGELVAQVEAKKGRQVDLHVIADADDVLGVAVLVELTFNRTMGGRR